MHEYSRVCPTCGEGYNVPMCDLCHVATVAGQPSGVGEPPIKKFQVLMDRMVGVYRVAVEPVPSPLQPLQAIAQEQANQAWFIEQAISEKLEREK